MIMVQQAMMNWLKCKTLTHFFDYVNMLKIWTYLEIINFSCLQHTMDHLVFSSMLNKK